jgi:hypothetical protein
MASSNGTSDVGTSSSRSSSPQRLNTGEDEEQITSIASKIQTLNDQIKAINSEINAKRLEITTKTNDLQIQEEEKRGSFEEMRQLLNLTNELSALERELSSRERELSALDKSVRSGNYFAHLSHYWKVHPVDVEATGGSEINWTHYQRTTDQADNVQVRYCNKTLFSSDRPYEVTRNGATNPDTHIVPSEKARSTAWSQKDESIREKVWPTDIFGNSVKGQEIAHLLPAGTQYHKEWMYVAAAVVGIDFHASPAALKKAVRGFKNPNTNDQSRMPGTGVVHFVSNKLRMAHQAAFLDGDNPSALLIPVMKLSEAKSWNGTAYSALFVMGAPLNLMPPTPDPEDYVLVRLRTDAVMEGGVVRDAKMSEIEDARTTLIEAILALRSLLAQLTDQQIQGLDLNDKGRMDLENARKNAKKTYYNLPELIENTTDRKPLCLVTFGEASEEDKHPPPDPLLLAYKAANIWGSMVKGMRLLANGEKPDLSDDMSEGDYLAEMAFLEARSYYAKTPTWEELGARLGQPNGYQGC